MVTQIRFDHLIHLVPDLKVALLKYESLGFEPRMGGEHPGRGTHNASVRSGPTYIELLGVRDWAEFRRHEDERRRRYPKIPFRTEEIVRAGGGAGGFAVEVDEIRDVVATAQAAGLPMAQPTIGKIVRPDGSQAEWGMAGPTEGPSWLPFFIQYATPSGSGQQALPWVLDHVLIETADPVEGADLLARLLDLPGLPLKPGHFRIPLPGCAVHLVPGDAERITTVVFARATDPAGEVCGLRYDRVVPSLPRQTQPR